MKPGLDELQRARDPAAREFLGAPPERESLRSRARVEAARAPRPETIAAVRKTMQNLELAPAQTAALSRLEGGCAVVISGQQPGLYGGPLLVDFKIATTLRLSAWLRSEGISAVAVFWNASEDHDLDEANRLFLRDPGRVATELHHGEFEAAGSSLDEKILTAAGRAALRAAFAASGEGSPDPEDHPRAGEDLGAWMTRVLARRYAAEGLLVVEPRHLGEVSRRTLGAVLDDEERHRSALAERRDLVRARGWEPQLEELAPERSLVLRRDEFGRRRLERDPDGSLRDPLTGEAVVGESLGARGQLSSSAAVRGLVQQSAFAVAAQVSGPAEIRYAAELRPLFALHGLEAPLYWPRFRGALLAEEEEAAAEALGLALEDLLRPPSAWPVREPPRPDSWDEATEELTRRLAEALDDVERRCVRDGPLDDALGNLRRGVDRECAAFEKRLEKARHRRDADGRRRRRRLAEALWPRERPQERLRALACYDRFGSSGVLNAVLAAADPFDPAFRIVNVARDSASGSGEDEA